MFLRITFSAAALVAATVSGCSSARVPAPPVAAAPTGKPLVATSEVSQPAQPFSMLSADPERRAKLAALVPDLDTFFEARFRDAGATGAAVGIVLEGELVYARGLGVRDLESKAPVDSDTVFRIGSVSKTITALAILRLRDRGKLVLDEPAAKYWPPLGTLPLPTKDSPPISVRHLLTMTSGLPYDDVWGAVTFGYSDAELERLLAEGLSFSGAPGERYRYSNLGFALLGKIVEHVSGKPFERYVASEIFGPLGMSSSGYVTGGLPVDRMATGYYREGTELLPEPTPSDGVFAPAGGVYTSLNDLARYAAFQLAAYPPRNAPEIGPVRRSTLREMHTGQAWGRWAEDEPVVKRTPEGALHLAAFSYGLGWATNTTCLFEGMVQHGGFEPGYYAYVRLVPRHGFAVITLSTTTNLGPARTFEKLTDLLRDGGVLESRPHPVPPALVTARETVLQLLRAWDPELAARTFDPNTLRYSFVRHLREDWERLGRDHGACRAEGDVLALSQSHARFRLACERGALDFVAYLTPAASPVVQFVEWKQELPVTEKERARAAEIVAAFPKASIPGNTLDPRADRRALERRLARLHGTYGSCQLDHPAWNNGKGEATFRLRCAEKPLDLTLRLDPESSRVLDVSGAPPRSFGAVCAE